jgi:hypothetical protein
MSPTPMPCQWFGFLGKIGSCQWFGFLGKIG